MSNSLAFSQNMEDTLEIERQYGEQWDFCTCIVKNDSIQKVVMSTDLSDEDFDKILGRLEIVEQKCMASLLLYKVETSEERTIHTERVKDCLQNEK